MPFIEFALLYIHIWTPYAFIDLFDVYSYASYLYLLFLFHVSSFPWFAALRCNARILCKYALLSCLPPLFRQWLFRLPSVSLLWVLLFMAALAQADQIALTFFIIDIKRHRWKVFQMMHMMHDDRSLVLPFCFALLTFVMI